MFPWVGGDDSVKGHARFVVHPEHVLLAQVLAQRGHEAPGRGDAVPRADIRQFAVADARDDVVASRQAQQRGSGAGEAAARLEYEDLGGHLVDDHERHAGVVPSGHHPVGHAARGDRRGRAGEIGSRWDRDVALSQSRGRPGKGKAEAAEGEHGQAAPHDLGSDSSRHGAQFRSCLRG